MLNKCEKSRKSRTKFMVISVSVIVSVALILLGCAAYLGDFYHADSDAISAFSAMNAVNVSTDENGNLVFESDGASVGLIFYPGGKVEYTAYQPLMAACAENGILCVLVEMPFNLAVFDINAADGIREQYPKINSWYLGGHSLGGSMAASYLSDHTDEYEGLILLGSYSTADLSKADLTVLSVYGSEDLVMNREKYENNKSNLPLDTSEIIIDGGCHAYFGMYGAQDGDGTPTITNEEQILLTRDKISQILLSER